MSITLIIVVAVVTILVFILGLFIGVKQASKEFSEKMERAWIELNWYEKDWLKFIRKFNKIK